MIGSLLAGLLVGCATPSGAPDYTGTGALVGGVSGAGLGALIDRRNPGVGALIGGAAGAITGGLIGHSMDEQARTPVYVAVPPPPPAGAVVAAPAPGYVWVNGQWTWNGAAWVWSPGRWVLAP
jgi:phage tail tape-measure protein